MTLLQRTMQRVLLRMVSLEGGEFVRRRVPESELIYGEAGEDQRVQIVLGKLLFARLVVRGVESEGEPFVEPAHDALINGWSKLIQWAREEREQLALRSLLTPAAKDWRHNGGGTWHMNPRLTLLKAIQRQPDSWLNVMESDFVSQSIRKRRHTFIAAISGGGIAMGIVVFAMIFASIRAAETELAKQQRLETESVSSYRFAYQRWQDSQFSDSLAHLFESIHQNPNNNLATMRLANLLLHRSPPLRLADIKLSDSSIRQIEYISKSSSFVIRCADGSSWLIDSKTKQRLGELQFHIDNLEVDWETGKIICTVDNRISVFGADGRLLRGDIECPSNVTAIYPNEAGVFVGTEQGQLLCLNLESFDLEKIAQREQLISQISGSEDDQKVLVVEQGEREETVVAISVTTSMRAEKIGHVDLGENRVLAVGRDASVCLIYEDPGGLEEEAYDQLTILVSGEVVEEDWNGWEQRFSEGVDVAEATFSDSNTHLLVSLSGDRVGLFALEGVGEEVRVLMENLSSSSVSRKGELLATGNSDGEVRVWDGASGAALSLPLFHAGSIEKLAFSDDGESLLVGLDSGEVSLWSLTSPSGYTEVLSEKAPETVSGKINYPRLERRSETEGVEWNLFVDENTSAKTLIGGCSSEFDDSLWENFRIVSFGEAQLSPNSSRVVTFCGDGPIKIWDVTTGIELSQAATDNFSQEMIFSGDGTRCVIIAQSTYQTDPFNQREFVEYITVANLKEANFISRDTPLPRGGTLLAVSGNGLSGLLGVWDQLFEIDLATMEQLTEQSMKHADRIRYAGYLANDQTVYSVCRDGTIRVWDVLTGFEISEPLRFQGPIWGNPRADEDDEFYQLPEPIISADGQRLSIQTGSIDSDVSTLTERTWFVAPSLSLSDTATLVAFAEEIYGIASNGIEGSASTPQSTAAELLAKYSRSDNGALASIFRVVLEERLSNVNR